MRVSSSIIACALLLVVGNTASAQFLPPGGSVFNPPMPPPPPPPKIRAPVVPKMDAPPQQNYQPAPRPSFSDRINACLGDAAALGLRPAEREAYSRACALQ
jgi:hypothetical protein